MSKQFTRVIRRFAAGEVVFHEGDNWDGLYSIQTGRVEVFKTQGSKKLLLAEMGKGDLIGELGLFEPCQREATVKALEFTEILVITREMFEAQMSKVPPWYVGIFKVLAARLRTTNERLLETTRMLETLEKAS